MSETEQEDMEIDDLPYTCTTCNGTGQIHGCCDDLCRNKGWDEFGALCCHPRICFSCHGEGEIDA